MNTPYKSTPYASRKLRKEKTTLSDGSSDSVKEPVRVFCRLRPLKDDESDESCITLVSPTVLSLNSPVDPKYLPQRELHCQFKQIFTSYATQKEVFEFVAMPLLQDLFKGKNALLLSYGVTGSGKTYTLSGESNNPGIMPRSIDTIFNTIEELQAPKFTIKPDKMNGFLIQSEDEAAQERLLENKLGSKTLKGKNTRRGMGDQPQYVNDGTRISDIDESCSYAVFVSYIEIYNNTVYDLLEESNTKSLQPKILREDTQKNMYIIGVTEVEVKSADEAFEVLSIGQKKKRMGHTLLNSESSRSHSVFNIRLVQMEQVAHNSKGMEVVPDSNLIRVSQLSLVDLAGSERTNRTQTTGMRLKEAGRINNSLMCLRNCLEVLRENQLTGSNKLVPYRDSRLTFLFKNFFEGYGKVEMIVCVNPSIHDYEENLQVMKFAEMTQDVKIKRNEYKGTPIPRKTPKKIFNTNTPASASKIKATSAFTLPKIPTYSFEPDNFDEMGEKIEQIGKILKLRSSRMENYFCELNNKEKNFRKRLCGLNESNVLNISEMKSLKTIIKRNKEETYNLKNKIVDLETVNDSLASKNEELQDVIRSLKRTIDEKDLKINQKILEKEKVKQKFVIANEKMSQELDSKLRKQREHLQASMKAKDNKLKRVREILESDEAFEARSEQGEKEKEVESPPREIQPVSSPPICDIQTSNRRNIQTPGGRHRRSRSAGEVWLEHNSIKPVPLGTVLQPSVKKRKSLTKLTKASDITNPNQSKYCLIAQDQDTEGEIETKVYKGDIVPTCGGGAQVIFNDVELLKQKSPTATP
ncbi:kinesin-like protein KIF23 [Coccinella septempunctata]|uniref:kinesin-like protein KIF23 n=1 Tax=Coccinella septempunctata TaxID=41139 RepID=UPI001D086F90|nr:kinesin-like protein KIF23 [Coccinella septempunctata]